MRDDDREGQSFWTCFSKRAISERRSAMSPAEAGSGGRVGVDSVEVGVVMAFIMCDEVGVVTSMTLSIISANPRYAIED